MKTNNYAIGCSIFVIIIYIGTLGTLSIYYGITEKDNECQLGTRAGLKLYEWNIGIGLAHFIMMIISIIGIVFITKYSDFSNKLLSISGIISNIFMIIWCIIGIVILATNENNNCVADGNGMAVIAIINISLFVISLLKSQKCYIDSSVYQI